MVDSDARSLVQLFAVLWSKSDLGRCAESILWGEKMQAGGLQGKACGLRTTGGLVSVSGPYTGNRHNTLQSKANFCTLGWRRVCSTGQGVGGSRLALMLRVMRCFDLSFQHCYLPYRWEEAGRTSSAWAFQNPGESNQTGSLLREQEIAFCGGGKASVLSSTGK